VDLSTVLNYYYLLQLIYSQYVKELFFNRQKCKYADVQIENCR
jgi:hypothetical protein